MSGSVLLKLLSSLFILIPLGFSFRVYKAGIHFRLFAFFLLAGFLTDTLGAFHHVIQPLPDYIMDNRIPVYSLVEALFFTWFIAEVSNTGYLKSFALPFLFFILVLWMCLVVLFPGSIYGNPTLNIFEATYQVIVSFFSSALLLSIIEKQRSGKLSAEFWLLMAIFLYTFSTFFQALLKNTVYQEIVWPIHNVLNILTYLLYTKGFMTAKSKD